MEKQLQTEGAARTQTQWREEGDLGEVARDWDGGAPGGGCTWAGARPSEAWLEMLDLGSRNIVRWVL